jgi:pimeloyl-ACP methyl ester carboxylesterase
MRKRWMYFSFPVLVLVGVYFLGPAPKKPVWSDRSYSAPQQPDELEKYVRDQEQKHKLKPDNEARIIWADSTRQRTPYSIVYLHGFSASQKEGDPVHLNFAKEFGCNLYLARLADHGVDTTEQLLYFTPDRWWESCKEALAIGKALGDKVILMSTSTGGTMALILAAEYPEQVHALINMSPNIAINNPTAWLLNDPWGLQIARMVIGSDYQTIPYDSARQIYWNGKYRLESLTQLEELIEDKMNHETFQKVRQPSLTLYYYKNDTAQDPTVKVSAMLEMNKQLGTPEDLKVAIPVPNAGFHVIGSSLVSKDLETVQNEVRKFAIEKLKMEPKK